MRRWPRGIILISAVFVVSRIIAYAAGVRFDTAGLSGAIQTIDPVLMKGRLLESLFYLHSQPPLFNLFVGLVYKIGGAYHQHIFAGLFLINSYLLGTGMYVLLRRLRIGEGLAIGLAVYLIVNPAVILLENWLMYTAFLMCGLCWAAVYVHKFVEEGYARDSMIFFGILSVLALTKSIFHWLWLGGVIIILLVLARDRRQWTITAGLMAVIVVGSVYLKNYVVFGKFSLGRMWMVTNLQEMATKDIPREDMMRLAREGKVGIFASADTFKDIALRRPDLVEARREQIRRQVTTDVPILRQVHRPTTKDVSWHSLHQYILADEYWQNARYLIRHYPWAYLRSMKRAYMISFFPAPTDATFANRWRLAAYENAFNFMFAHLNRINDGELYTDRLLLWYRFRDMRWDLLSAGLYALVVSLYAGTVAAAAWLCLRSLRRNDVDRPVLVCAVFMLFTVFFAVAGSNTLAWIGSNRYRFVVEPYFLALFALVLHHWRSGRANGGG